MPAKRTPPKDTQARRFIETARKLGCDESESAFERKLAKIAKAKPSKPGKKAEKK